MVDPGLVGWRLARVAKKPRRMVSFHLTPEGEREASRILEAAKAESGVVEVEALILAPAKSVRANEMGALKDRVRKMEEQLVHIRRRIELIESVKFEGMEELNRLYKRGSSGNI